MNSSNRWRGVRSMLITVLRDRDSFDQFHDEVGPAALGGARIKHLGDVRMLHQGQRLPLCLESRNDLPRVHARLNDFQRDAAENGRLLIGHVDDAHSPFADLLQQLVRPDDRAGSFELCFVGGRGEGSRRVSSLEKIAGFVVGVEQGLDLGSQSGIFAANAIQVGNPRFGRVARQCVRKNRHDLRVRMAHRLSVRIGLPLPRAFGHLFMPR